MVCHITELGTSYRFPTICRIYVPRNIRNNEYAIFRPQIGLFPFFVARILAFLQFDSISEYNTRLQITKAAYLTSGNHRECLRDLESISSTFYARVFVQKQIEQLFSSYIWLCNFLVQIALIKC